MNRKVLFTILFLSIPFASGCVYMESNNSLSEKYTDGYLSIIEENKDRYLANAMELNQVKSSEYLKVRLIRIGYFDILEDDGSERRVFRIDIAVSNIINETIDVYLVDIIPSQTFLVDVSEGRQFPAIPIFLPDSVDYYTGSYIDGKVLSNVTKKGFVVFDYNETMNNNFRLYIDTLGFGEFEFNFEI